MKAVIMWSQLLSICLETRIVIITDDFETSLHVLRGFETCLQLRLMKSSLQRLVASSTKRSSTVRFVDLKQRRYYFPLMVGIGLLVLQQLGGTNDVLFYSSTIFEYAGVTSSNAATFGVGAIQVVETAISTWLVDKAGRGLMLIISSVGMMISLVIVAAAFYLKGFVSHDSDMYNMLRILSVVGAVVHERDVREQHGLANASSKDSSDTAMKMSFKHTSVILWLYASVEGICESSWSNWRNITFAGGTF